MNTSHSKILLSSKRPTDMPSGGDLFSSVYSSEIMSKCSVDVVFVGHSMSAMSKWIKGKEGTEDE